MTAHRTSCLGIYKDHILDQIRYSRIVHMLFVIFITLNGFVFYLTIDCYKINTVTSCNGILILNILITIPVLTIMIILVYYYLFKSKKVVPSEQTELDTIENSSVNSNIRISIPEENPLDSKMQSNPMLDTPSDRTSSNNSSSNDLLIKSPKLPRSRSSSSRSPRSPNSPKRSPKQLEIVSNADFTIKNPMNQQ